MAKFVIALGEAGSIEVEDATFTQAVKDYVYHYGLKQMLNDVHASVTKKVESDDVKRAEAKRAMVEKKLASLMAGEVAQARVGGGDPVAKEMRKMAEADLKAKLVKLGKKVSDFNKDVWAEVVGKQVTAGEANYRKAAEAKLAIKAEPVKDSVDLSDLLGL